MSYQEYIPSKEKIISTIDITPENRNWKDVFGFTNMRIFHFIKDGRNKAYYSDLRLDEICRIENTMLGRRGFLIFLGIIALWVGVAFFAGSLVAGSLVAGSLPLLFILLPFSLTCITTGIILIILGSNRKRFVAIYDKDSKWGSFLYKKEYLENMKDFIQTIYYECSKSQV